MGYRGGNNLRQYCTNSPLGNTDPRGTNVTIHWDAHDLALPFHRTFFQFERTLGFSFLSRYPCMRMEISKDRLQLTDIIGHIPLEPNGCRRVPSDQLLVWGLNSYFEMMLQASCYITKDDCPQGKSCVWNEPRTLATPQITLPFPIPYPNLRNPTCLVMAIAAVTFRVSAQTGCCKRNQAPPLDPFGNLIPH